MFSKVVVGRNFGGYVSSRLFNTSVARCSTTSGPVKTEPGLQVENSSKEEGAFTEKLENSQVFFHPRYNAFVCWHPEVEFPYEMTRPIDTNAPITDSYLKIQALTPVKEAYRRKHEKVTVQELIKLTYSTKHRFFGQFGKRKRLILREMDPTKERRNREYL